MDIKGAPRVRLIRPPTKGYHPLPPYPFLSLPYLPGPPPCKAGSAAESELAEHVLPLIYELHKVAPKMLLYILPNVSAQLQAEEAEVWCGYVIGQKRHDV